MNLNPKILDVFKQEFGKENIGVTVSFADETVTCKIDTCLLANRYFADNYPINILLKDFKYAEVTLYPESEGSGYITADIYFFIDKDNYCSFDEILSKQLSSFYFDNENAIDDVIDIVQYVDGIKGDNTDSSDVFLFNLNCELVDSKEKFEDKLEADLRKLAFIEDKEDEDEEE